MLAAHTPVSSSPQSSEGDTVTAPILQMGKQSSGDKSNESAGMEPKYRSVHQQTLVFLHPSCAPLVLCQCLSNWGWLLFGELREPGFWSMTTSLKGGRT